VLARFVPFVRSFAPVLAGVGQLPYRKFLAYNIFGGLLWVLSLGLLGFYLGSTVPNIDRIILPIIGVIVVVSILLVLVSFLRRPTKASG
ncbi:MAG: DedA family protein, partial [Patescibacteria group bacterium]